MLTSKEVGIHYEIDQKALKPVYVANGVTGITTIKSGYAVQLSVSIVFTATSSDFEKWKKIGTFPASLRPHSSLKFGGYDNSASRYDNSHVLQYKLDTNGDFSVWIFPDRTNYAAVGTFFYLATNADTD